MKNNKKILNYFFSVMFNRERKLLHLITHDIVVKRTYISMNRADGISDYASECGSCMSFK